MKVVVFCRCARAGLQFQPVLPGHAPEQVSVHLRQPHLQSRVHAHIHRLVFRQDDRCVAAFTVVIKYTDWCFGKIGV